MKRKILIKNKRKIKLKYKNLPKIHLSIKSILEKLILILLFLILYKNNYIHYLIKEKLKLRLKQYQSKVLSEIISFVNNLSITKEEMNEFNNINNNKSIEEKEKLKLILKLYQSKVLPDIISFENNLSITKDEMNEFRNINSNNKLIENNNFEKSSYPDVSIIMTMYNQAHCIHKGIRSIQNQSLKNIEIIIVDDCSQDNGTDVIKEFQKEDPRIILISHDMNEGEMKSRTDGIRKAKGKYITIIDGDDALIHKNILKNCLFIAQKGKLDVVEFKGITYWRGYLTNTVYNYYNKKEFIDVIIYQPELRDKFINRKNLCFDNRVIWGKFIRNDLFKELLIYLGKEYTDDYINEAEDTIMAVGLYHLANSYYILKEPGYVYSFEEKKNKFPLINKTVCKINNKVKRFGWYKYFQFLVDKNSKNDLEKNNILAEMKGADSRKELNMKLSDEYYQILFHIYDTMLKWEFYNEQQTNYIINIKNNITKKRNEDINK